jgi:hypothetical protein
LRWVKAFAIFWYDFVVGDDWRLAIGVVIGLGLTALIQRTGAPAWWALPVCVSVLLGWSLRRAAKRR